MNIQFKLPFAEEIYDFDTFELNDQFSRISKYYNDLNKVDQISSEELAKKQKKAKKILDMIELEINERKTVENMFIGNS